MMNLLAANTMFGLVPFEGTWLTISIVVAIIGLIILGYFYDEDTGPLIILEGCIVVTISLFWGFVLIFAVGLAVIALPIGVGFYVRKLKRKRDEKKEKELESMSDIEKMKKSRS